VWGRCSTAAPRGHASCNPPALSLDLDLDPDLDLDLDLDLDPGVGVEHHRLVEAGADPLMPAIGKPIVSAG
jgi:hypothetical protein